MAECELQLMPGLWLSTDTQPPRLTFWAQPSMARITGKQVEATEATPGYDRPLWATVVLLILQVT
jgi:hypothetical protein